LIETNQADNFAFDDADDQGCPPMQNQLLQPKSREKYDKQEEDNKTTEGERERERERERDR